MKKIVLCCILLVFVVAVGVNIPNPGFLYGQEAIKQAPQVQTPPKGGMSDEDIEALAEFLAKFHVLFQELAEYSMTLTPEEYIKFWMEFALRLHQETGLPVEIK